jgi:hypothetical protein
MTRGGILVAAALLLAACSSDSSSTSTGNTGSGNTGGGTAASKAAAADSGGDAGGGFFDRLFSNDKKTLTCPTVTRIGEATRLTRFVPGGHDLTDVAFEARIGGITGNCSADKKAVKVQMNAQFIANRGPADKARKAPFAYFVAIADNDDNVLARQDFDTVIAFPGTQTRNGVEEQLDQIIPIKKGQQGSDFHIYIGFDLTPEEIAYNRAHPQ